MGRVRIARFWAGMQKSPESRMLSKNKVAAERASSRGVICDLCGCEIIRPKRERQRDIVQPPGDDRLSSPHLERLAANLVAYWENSGMTKPDFAESLGMSGSQFRDVRRRKANPKIEALARIAANLKTPLFELLEDKKLGKRKNLSAKRMIESLGAIVKQTYESSELEKEEFAKIIGVSVSQLYVIMRGKSNPSFLKAMDIARRINMGVWMVLGDLVAAMPVSRDFKEIPRKRLPVFMAGADHAFQASFERQTPHSPPTSSGHELARI